MASRREPLLITIGYCIRYLNYPEQATGTGTQETAFLNRQTASLICSKFLLSIL